MTLIEHIKLIEYFATQALIHIQAQKYYKAYIELDEVKVLTIKFTSCIDKNPSYTIR